jgi:hypothetical protein
VIAHLVFPGEQMLPGRMLQITTIEAEIELLGKDDLLVSEQIGRRSEKTTAKAARV